MNISPNIRAQHACIVSTFDTMVSYLPNFSTIEVVTDEDGAVDSPFVSYYFHLADIRHIFTRLIFQRLGLGIRQSWLEQFSASIQCAILYLSLEYLKEYVGQTD